MKAQPKRSGFSLLELLAVVVILGIIAAVVVPRVTVSSSTAKSKVNVHTAATLNSAIERYYIDNGSWPANLAALVPTYLPGGVPTNPVDGSAYGIDATSHRVTGTGL
ncbi:MAG: type II secretion system GspH family protein [Pirellulales bacterium]|nr:type II secretion system GspH family protein [Pirellulales bacterium]